MRTSLSLLFAILAFTACWSAHAADPPECKNLLKEAASLQGLHTSAELVEKNEEVHHLCPSSAYLFSCAIGEMLQKSRSKPVDAFLFYQRCKMDAPKEDRQTQRMANRAIRELKPKVVLVDVICNREGTTIYVGEDERARGQIPLTEPLAVEPDREVLIRGRWLGIDRTDTVVAKAGTVAHASLIFDTLPGRGSVVSNKEGSVVQLDRPDVGETPLPGASDLPVGDHAAEVKTIEFKDLTPVHQAPTTAQTADVRPWYKSRWVPWVAGVAAVSSAIAIGLVCCRQDRYPVPTMGSQNIGE
jgi:hypothetical protein